jgi:hypothetical protein
LTSLSESEVRFRSDLHPGDVAAPVAFGHFLVRPIAATMVPAMLVGLVLVLQQQDPLPYVLWSFPLALALAGIWTWFRIRSVIVEFVVTRNGAAALTVMEAVHSRSRPHIQRVFDARAVARGAQVTVGHATYTLETEHWDDLAELLKSLTAAKAYYEDPGGHSR